MTQETPGLWQIVIQEYSCAHELRSIVKRTQSNGSIRIYEQCDKCGKFVQNILRKTYSDSEIDSLPEWEPTLQDNWSALRSQRLKQLMVDREAQRVQDLAQSLEQQSIEWWKKYNEYLKSLAWRSIRQKVLKRDAELCQSCLERKATQVHHTSYELFNQLGRSAAFELISICYQCHSTIHPHIANLQQITLDG